MSDVKRYAVYDRHLSQGGGHEIEEDTDGDFVRHSDYAALRARLADLETKLGEVEADNAALQLQISLSMHNHDAAEAEAARLTAQLTTARRDALEEAAKCCEIEADNCDDAAKWGGSPKYIKACRDAAYAMRDRARAIRALIAQEEPTT